MFTDVPYCRGSLYAHLDFAIGKGKLCHATLHSPGFSKAHASVQGDKYDIGATVDH